MRINFNIEEPSNKKHLQENSFKVPAGYFNSVRMDISDKISAQSEKVSFWTVVRPQLGLVSAFVIVFLFAYGIFQIFPAHGNLPTEDKLELTTTIASSSHEYVEEGFLSTSFIDFFDSSLDTLTTPNTKISQDELFNYLSENIDLVTLSYLD